MKYLVNLILTFLIPISGFTQTALTTCKCPQTWPPKPQNIVTLDSINDPNADPSGNVPINPMGTYSIYTVPTTRALILTTIIMSSGSGMIIQERNGTLTTGKVNYPFAILGTSPAVGNPGIVFAPGTEIVVFNNSGSPTSFTYHFEGYLTTP